MKVWNKPTLTELSTMYTKGGGHSDTHDGVKVSTPYGPAELYGPLSGEVVVQP